MLHTTCFQIHGHEVVQEFGIVRGLIVRSRSIVGSFGASIQTIFGGNISLFTELCERARHDAFEAMLQNAKNMGANAVVGVRYDANEIAQGVTEVLCYGTAVLLRQTPPR